MPNLTSQQVMDNLSEDTVHTLGVIYDTDPDLRDQSISTVGPGTKHVLLAYGIVIERAEPNMPRLRLTEFGIAITAVCFRRTPASIVQAKRRDRRQAQARLHPQLK